MLAHLRRNPWVIFVIVATGQLMVVIDVTVVFTALPSIQRHLGLTDNERQWVVNSYTLLFGGCLMLGGRLADLLGRRRIFLLGIAVFTAASTANALAGSPELLIASRAVQGLGSAMLAPAALSIVTVTFPPGRSRATAMAAWGATGAVAGGLGVLIGGALTQFLAWQWIFLINVPIGVLAGVAALIFVPGERGVGGSRQEFDFGGAITVTSGIMLLAMGIVQVDTSGWLSAPTLGYLAGAVVFLVAFVMLELRHDAPLVPLGRLRNRMLISSNAVLSIAYGLMTGMLFFVSLYVQAVLHFKPFEGGAAYIPYFIAAIACALLSERTAPRFGMRPYLIAGMTITIAGVVLLTQVSPSGTYMSAVLPGIALLGAGNGFIYGNLTLMANNCLGDDDAGLASGLYNTATQIGAVLVVAVFSAIGTSAAKGAANPLVGLTDGLSAAFTLTAVVLGITLLAVIVLFRKSVLANMADGSVTADPVPAPDAPMPSPGDELQRKSSIAVHRALTLVSSRDP